MAAAIYSISLDADPGMNVRLIEDLLLVWIQMHTFELCSPCKASWPQGYGLTEDHIGGNTSHVHNHAVHQGFVTKCDVAMRLSALDGRTPSTFHELSSIFTFFSTSTPSLLSPDLTYACCAHSVSLHEGLPTCGPARWCFAGHDMRPRHIRYRQGRSCGNH